nr:Maf family protein [uncultured Faecalimonas sp.]
MKKIILASGSPRRRELLEQIGYTFEIVTSAKEEVYQSTEPQEIVKELALLKAKDVAEKIREEKALSEKTLPKKRMPEKDTEQKMTEENVASEMEIPYEEDSGCVIIGADTIVVHCGKILGKPKDEEDAVRMLTALQDGAHEVYTGVAVICCDRDGSEEVISHAVGTKVYVDPMTEEEIREYIATGEPMDKAGAYGIQGRFAAHISKIEGDYYNVVGLPVSYIYQVLREKI